MGPWSSSKPAPPPASHLFRRREDHALATLGGGRGDGRCDMIGPKADDEILNRSQRHGSLLYRVAEADPDLLRPVVLLDRHARLRVDEVGDRAAVQISVAHVECRAGRELVSETCRERPGKAIGRGAE